LERLPHPASGKPACSQRYRQSGKALFGTGIGQTIRDNAAIARTRHRQRRKITGMSAT